MGESIRVIGREEIDADDRKTLVGGNFFLSECVVTPQGKIDVYEQDVEGGNVLELQVTYPASQPALKDETLLEIRGHVYKTKFPSWDFHEGRRAWLQLHAPKQVVICELVEA